MLGRAGVVKNLHPHFGSTSEYWFLKVQSGPAEWQEEYWLVTEAERSAFVKKGIACNHPSNGFFPGRLHMISFEPDFGFRLDGVIVIISDGTKKWREFWVLSASSLERIRQRVERNAEDIQANRESWLADLID